MLRLLWLSSHGLNRPCKQASATRSFPCVCGRDAMLHEQTCLTNSSARVCSTSSLCFRASCTARSAERAGVMPHGRLPVGRRTRVRARAYHVSATCPRGCRAGGRCGGCGARRHCCGRSCDRHRDGRSCHVWRHAERVCPCAQPNIHAWAASRMYRANPRGYTWLRSSAYGS